LDANIFHSSYYRLPDNPRIPSVVTVHDFTYERFRSGPPQWAHSMQKKAAIKHAQSIICISESTKEDLLELIGVRENQSIHVIYNGASELFRQLTIAGPEKPFILFVGDRSPYKNFPVALAALEYLSNVELICVGGGRLDVEELKGVSSLNRMRVKHAGFISDVELNELYNKAICLLYPSKYEGFGIPVIEAMKAGCPVISINCKAVLEVGGRALEIAPSECPRDIAQCVERLCDPLYRQEKIQSGIERAKKFDWTACHEKTIEIYRSLIR
jgi:mannosyltransferase